MLFIDVYCLITILHISKLYLQVLKPFVDIFPVPSENHSKTPQVRLAEQRRREKVEQQTKIKTPRRHCFGRGFFTTVVWELLCGARGSGNTR